MELDNLGEGCLTCSGCGKFFVLEIATRPKFIMRKMEGQDAK